MSVRAFSHIALRVTDLDRSLRFYRDGLGFVEISRVEVEGGPTALLLGAPKAMLSAIFLERDGISLELQTLVLPDGRPLEMPDVGLGWSHIGVRVDDVEETAAALRALGGEIVEASRYRDPELGSHVVFVNDPDGARVELIELPGESDQIVGTPSGS